MKKFVAMVLCAVLMLCLAGCAGGSADTNNVGGVNDAAGNENAGGAEVGGKAEVTAEILEMLGMSEEEFAALDPAEQEAIVGEFNAVLDQQKENEKTEQAQQSAKYTPDDVMAGGSYKVVLGDYMNSITLYYENGKLVKIVEEFQKNDEEMAESFTYEGDTLADYTFNFIDWDGSSLQEILDGMKDYGGFGEYRISKTE